MAPALINYPKNIKDILKLVKYASENDIGITVRAGGQQPCGASSTSGRNIQLNQLNESPTKLTELFVHSLAIRNPNTI